jgi:hypothetical protein
MDNPALQKAVAKAPRLVHFVVNTPDIKAARMAIRMQGIDRGPAIAGNRRTNRGTLNWQISVRADGQRLFDGCMPTLIQWGKPDATDPLKLQNIVTDELDRYKGLSTQKNIDWIMLEPDFTAAFTTECCNGGARGKLLVVGTLSTLRFVWEAEAFRTLPTRKVAVLHGSKAKRLERLADPTIEIFIINH